MSYAAKWCRTEGLVQELTPEDVEVLKKLLWNWARMLANKHGSMLRGPMAKELMKPMLNVIQKGIDQEVYQ